MRTYSYGAKTPTEGIEAVRVQLHLAHRYRNLLTELERSRRAARDETLAPYLAARVEAKKAAPTDRLPALSSQLSTADAAQLAQIDTVHAAYVRAARSECNVYWGTYLLIEDAAQRARQSRDTPHFTRWAGVGNLGVQLQGGLTVEGLTSCEDTRVRLSGTGEHRTLWLRIGSDGRAPVWAKFPVVYHRDLPVDANIKWVRVSARRVATKTKWSAQFVLETAHATLPVPKLGTIAIDVGWRRFRERKGGDGLRVAAWVDDVGRFGELRLPEVLLERWQKVCDLGSIRDKNHNAALAELLTVRRGGAAWPEWLREATEHAHAWNKPARLAGLVWRWQHERASETPSLSAGITNINISIPLRENTAALAPWDALLARLEAWRKQDKHLYEWEANQRENILRARREAYRLFAKFAATYAAVVVEDLDLRDFAELPDVAAGDEKDTPQQEAARPNRFKASISELLGCLVDAAGRSGSAWKEIEPAWTTQTCAVCSQREEFDAATEINHVCTQCGYIWDQDYNAARNLLRAVRSGAISPERSRAEKRARLVISASAQRRQDGKAKKKAMALEMDK